MRLQVLQARHNTLVASHFGFNKTMELMSCDYWWSQFWKFVKEFVGSCDICACTKNPHHHLHGPLEPLLVHVFPWFSISMDFIMGLQRTNFFDSILVVVHCLTKMAHFIPCNKSITSEKTVKLFDALPSHGVKPTWGFHKVKLRKLWLSGTLLASNSKKG